MPSDNPRSELVQLLDELDQLAEEQRLIDGRDPNALADCERKLEDLRRRIGRLRQRRNESSGTRSWMPDA